MGDVKLSWVLTTRNKLAFLTEVLTRLTRTVRADEELIVVDGGSTDGTVDYLRALHEASQIHHFISERDNGEAHGFNKGFLLARGELIKPITDDDAFHWSGIHACREFMLAHPQVDVLGTDGAAINWSDPDLFHPLVYCEPYQEWKDRSKPFEFCGLGLLIRRSSLALTGLFGPGFERVDAEFAFRVTFGLASLAWYTGYNYVRITNPHSKSVRKHDRMSEELSKLQQFYLGKQPTAPGFPAKINRSLRSLAARMIRANRIVGRSPSVDLASMQRRNAPDDWPAVFELSYNWLREQNRAITGQFLFRDAS